MWSSGTLAYVGYQACGTYPLQIRLQVPKKLGKFVLNLRRNVLAWSGNGSGYRFLIRTGSPTGKIAYEQLGSLGHIRADITKGVKKYRKQGFVDLFPTIECTGDGWTYYPDSDWGGWDIEAYNIGGKAHDLGDLQDVSAWYQNHLDRPEDLAKYDLVILGAVYPQDADEIAELKAAGVTVAGYVSFGEDPRPDATPLAGDGGGPGGFDSRYVDFKDASGVKVPDGYPDYKSYGGGRNFYTDPASASWRAVILEKVGQAASAGADAVFLDTFFVTHPSLEAGVRPLVESITAAHPGIKVVVNGYDLYKEVAGIVNGVMFESFTYAPGGARLSEADLAYRAGQAAFANLLRNHPTGPTFDVFTLDYVKPYEDWAKFEDAVAVAEANGITASFWEMTVINPAIDLTASVTGAGVVLSWDTYDDDTDPEAMAGVGRYEVLRSTAPIDVANENAATVVATSLPPGTRSFTDASAPASGPIYYALRAYRTGSDRLLAGVVTVQAR
ncbi:MAG: hypothetical protein HY658_06225 [Actinobacteria bacterium]|nr:hypothetical protein [Actinomycetota bacterium]